MEDRENRKENPVSYLDGALNLPSKHGLNTLDKGFSIGKKNRNDLIEDLSEWEILWLMKIAHKKYFIQ